MSQPHNPSVNLLKTAAVTMSVIAGMLGFAYQRLELKSEQVAAQTEPQQPNVVVIMADDLSVGELNEAVSKGWMPNLKGDLIDRGTTFTQSFVSYSLCCPSRSTFLTGQYPHNHGVLSNALPEGGVTKLKDSSTLATWLKRVGYKTCLVGKYLNGYGQNLVADARSDDPTYIPPGWDDWQAISKQGYYNYSINDNGTLVRYGADPKEYQTDVLAERSVSFISESEASDPTPFFLFITPFAPHLQATPAPRHRGTASNIPLPQPPSFNELDVSDKPAWIQRRPQQGPSTKAAGNNKPAQLRSKPQLSSQKITQTQGWYRSRLESLRAVDDLIGNVVSALAQNGELDNTVLLFTSDNGFMFGEHRLREKTPVYEESIRVPLFVRAPEFPKQSVSHLVINNDLAPTIADFAGATPDVAVDGRSLTPLLREPSLVNWRKRFLVELYAASARSYFAVRTGVMDTETPNQVYVEYSGGNQEFYDLAIDPYQLQSLHNEADMRQQQRQILQNRLADLKACSGESCRTLEDN